MILKFWRGGVILLGIGLTFSFWPVLPLAGQTPEPALNTLMVELWPEYDRPEVLVIYQAELSQTTPLPAEVTFALPGYIDEMFVVAVEQNGRLFEARPDTFSLSQSGDSTLFTLSVPASRFQFEYYDPEILRRQVDTRTMTFKFSTLYAIKQALFQVQEPPDSNDFALTPAAESSFVGPDGLNYSRLQRLNLVAGETFTVATTYRRSSDALTIQNSSNGSGPPAGVAEINSAIAPENGNLTLGYILIGIGSLLFLAAGGSWWWARRQLVAVPPPRHKRTVSSTRQTHDATQPRRQSAKTVAAYCYRCSTALRDEANFCHNCGAARRESR